MRTYKYLAFYANLMAINYPKMPQNWHFWPIVAPVAPNGWISVDIGWNLVGYIQNGLKVPFGPTKIAPRGGQK